MANAVLADRHGTCGRADGSAAGRAPCAAAMIAPSSCSTSATSAGSTRYVLGMVKDHGRAEDVTQEVFVSALRRMRETEQPLAFKPWIYQIAKNACIDAFRRSKRAEEVSYDADDGSRRPITCSSSRRARAGRRGRRQAGPRPPLRRVRRPLRDPPRDPRPARARGPELPGDRRAHGHEPPGRRVHALPRPPTADRGVRRPRLGRALPAHPADHLHRGARARPRDTRRLARHLSHCQPCRLLAAHEGLDIPVPVRRRIAGKIAGLLPLPGFLRFRGGNDASSLGGSSWMVQMPASPSR